MSIQSPEVSVVIPSHNRRLSVLRTLEALARQSIDPQRFEVIVALDAPSDGSVEALKARDWPMTVRVTIPDGRGASMARNTGAALAQADRLIFLDDDVEVNPEFIASHLRAGRENPDAVVLAEYAPAVPDKGWFYDGLRNYWRDHYAEVKLPGHRFTYLDTFSGNMSLSRRLFDKVGGFDTTIQCREDYEIGYRLLLAGARLVFEEGAHGLHYDMTDLARSMSRARAEGVGDVQIARKHLALFRMMRVANLTSGARSGRVLRTAVFRFPGFGKTCARTVLALLPALQWLGLRGLWQRGYNAARLFHYYAGAASMLEFETELQDLSNLNTRAYREPDELTVDLMQGIPAISAQVTARRPRSLKIMFGSWQVNYLWDAPGAERLETRHLTRALEDTVYSWSKFASALEDLPPLPPDDPENMIAVTPRCYAGFALGTVDLADWSMTARNGALVYPMRLLVRRGAIPLGWSHLIAPPAAGQFWHYLRQNILNDRQVVDGLIRTKLLPAPVTPEPGISVVICTRDRVDTLRRCLAAVQALAYPTFEVIVVDNASSTDATRLLVESFPGIRYVREDRPGLDWARNRGIAEARHEIVAFTDDDTQADAFWLRGLAGAFAEPGVDAVTGLVVPKKLDTVARVYFEDVYGGMGRGFTSWFRPGGSVSTRDMLWSSGCGVGANMAFRRSVFDKVGPFDPALDVGTATRGGGDIEMFHRVMARGAGLSYAPEAFVWHEHRADFPALLRQIHDNGSGFAAYLMAAWRNRTVPRRAIATFALKDWIWSWQIKRLLRPGRHRRDTVFSELGGLMQSRGLYRKALADAERLASQPTPDRDVAS